MGLTIYGADFSGAEKFPDGHKYAEGRLSGSTLHIFGLKAYKDRSELARAIICSRAPWALDFPFSYPQRCLTRLGLAGWIDLLKLIGCHDRRSFMAFLEHRIPDRFEGTCSEQNLFCRLIDVSLGAKSPLKRFNPNMRAMTYGGLSMLGVLNALQVPVYPFDQFDASKPRIYEVYPSHTWSKVGLRRSADVELFLKRFNDLGIMRVTLEDSAKPVNDDQADSIVACVILGTAIVAHDLDDDWNLKPDFASPEEWNLRQAEGLIIRI